GAVTVATLPEYVQARAALAPDGTAYVTYAERLRSCVGGTRDGMACTADSDCQSVPLDPFALTGACSPREARIRVVEIHSADTGITSSQLPDVDQFDDSKHSQGSGNYSPQFEFQPRIAVASDGTLGVSWYDQRRREVGTTCANGDPCSDQTQCADLSM